MSGFGFGADRFGWTDEALAELRRLRGWTEAAVERLELVYHPPSGTVGFPIRDATLTELGVVRYLPRLEQRNGRPKMTQPAGVPRELFPPPESLPDGPRRILLVEGEPDTVAAWSAGLEAVGVPGVAGWHAHDAGRFRSRRWTVYVVFDCDTSGRRAAGDIAATLAEQGVDVHVVELDPARDDGYDVTDYLLEHDAGELVELLEHAGDYTPPDAAPWRSTPWSVFRDTSPDEHRWLIEGLLPAGALAFVAGPPKKGKTWLGIALALALAAGRPLLGYTVAPTSVLYVALEGSRVGIRARIGALARGLGVDPDGDELERLHMLYRPRPFNLVELATAEWLLDEANRVDAGLVIVDVLRAAARFRENDAEDFARVRDGLEPLLAGDRTALLLHHFGKLNETQKERSPGERMAGTGAMYGALDVGLLITQSTDGARRMRVDVEARDFAAPDAIGIAIKGDGSGEHGGFTYTDAATLELDLTAAGLRDLIAEALEAVLEAEVWLAGDELAEQLGVNRKTLELELEADTKNRVELGEPARLVRWDRDGRELPAKSDDAKPWAWNAKPYGTPAMYEKARSEGSVGSTEQTEQLDIGSVERLGPPYGGTDGTEPFDEADAGATEDELF
jgi:hypothetical protein